jgi:capsular exopolysaccharide synthesis family protein
LELREYVRACRRRWPWLLVPVLIATAVAAGLSLSAPPAYRSSTVLFITTGSADPDAKASRLNSYIALLTGPRVAQSVVAKLGPPLTAAEVQESLSAQVQDGTDLLVGLAKQLDPPSAAGDGPKPSVTVAQDPVTTREPGNLTRNLLFSAVLGLLAGAIAVAVRQAARKTIAEEDDLRRLGLGTVGVIALPRSAGPPGEVIAEGFRHLRALLPQTGSLLLTGSHPKEGTTAVACGLAIAMAETGAKVVLVDANLRSPGVGRYLGTENGPGLADVLAGRASIPEVLRDSLDGRLKVLPCGVSGADPGVLLASPRLGAAVRALTETFDMVLVDAPPLHGVADPVVLSKVTDSALLVVRADRTRVDDVARSMDLLERVGARLAGAVLNALPRRLPAGTALHRPRAAMPEQDGLNLVTGEAVETAVIVPPVRATARVAPRGKAKVEPEPAPKPEPEPEPDDDE